MKKNLLKLKIENIAQNLFIYLKTFLKRELYINYKLKKDKYKSNI